MSAESSGNLVEIAHSNAQAVLIELLRATGDIAGTFLASARLQAQMKSDRLEVTLHKVEDALDSIRYFTPRVEDVTVSAEIRLKTKQQEIELAEFAPLRRTRGKLIAFPVSNSPVALAASPRAARRTRRVGN